MTSQAGQSDTLQGDHLWTCPACEMIGERPEALAHSEETGHTVEVLSVETTAAVRAVWSEEQTERIAALILYARRWR